MNKANKKLLEFLGIDSSMVTKVIIIATSNELPQVRITKMLNDKSIKTTKQVLKLIDEET